MTSTPRTTYVRQLIFGPSRKFLDDFLARIATMKKIHMKKGFVF
jgi:hypothetical protein